MAKETINLAEDLSAQLNNICSDEARAKIEVANIDAWVSGSSNRTIARSILSIPEVRCMKVVGKTQ